MVHWNMHYKSFELPIKQLSYDWVLDRLTNKEPFTFVRYGDGEFQAMRGLSGANCDGVRYSKNLGTDLLATLKYPGNYIYGLVRIAAKEFPDLPAWLMKNGISIDWVDGTEFVDQSRAGNLAPLVAALRNSWTLYIGPAKLRQLDQIFPIHRFLEVDPKNAYGSMWKTILQAESYIKFASPDVVAVSAGPAAKIIIHELHSMFEPDTTTFIDFGSLWDGFVGPPTRSYMRDPAWNRNQIGVTV